MGWPVGCMTVGWRPELDAVVLPTAVAELYRRALDGDKGLRPTATGGTFTTTNAHHGAISQLDKSRAVSARGLAM